MSYACPEHFLYIFNLHGIIKKVINSNTVAISETTCSVAVWHNRKIYSSNSEFLSASVMYPGLFIALRSSAKTL